MSEEVKQCAEMTARAVNSIPADKREIAAKLTEAYAAGLAAGAELGLGGENAEKERRLTGCQK